MYFYGEFLIKFIRFSLNNSLYFKIVYIEQYNVNNIYFKNDNFL